MPRGPNRNAEPMQHSWEADRAAGGGSVAASLVKGPRHLLFPPTPLGVPGTEESKTITPVGLKSYVHMVLHMGTLTVTWESSILHYL